MIYEVINPSDPVTFTADDDNVAAIAVLVLGKGAFGCIKEGGTRVLPVLHFGGFNEWHAEFTKAQDCTLNTYIRKNRARLADVLETTAVCGIDDRKALDAAIGDGPAKAGERAAALERWNETKRTSLNNICAAARKLAALYRGPVTDEGADE